jgi:hypothetical protein
MLIRELLFELWVDVTAGTKQHYETAASISKHWY